MLRRRIAVLVLTALVLSGTATMVPLVAGGGPAGASAGTHKAGSFISTLVEGKAKLKFDCSSATGVYSLKVTNFNVVDSTGHSYVDGDTNVVVMVWASYTDRDYLYQATLSQNSTGLWGTTSAGTMQSSYCQSGNALVIVDHATQSTILMEAGLS